MSDPTDNEPEDTPVPPASNPPGDPVPDAPHIDNPLIAGMLSALEPVFKKMESAVTNLERRAVDQQKQIEDLTNNTAKIVEDRVVQAISVYEQSRNAAETADVVPPGQNPFQKAPAMGGIGGFVQQIMGWVLSPQGSQLIQTFQGGGQDMSFFKNWYGAAHEAFDRSMIRNMAKITGLSGLPEPLEINHEVVGDHVQ